MGGARPKALIEVDREQWVVKFADGDPVDTPAFRSIQEDKSSQVQARSGADVRGAW